jgi:hydrogenase 3 maturation protease
MMVLAEWLEQRRDGRPAAVVGVGNRLRRDDAAGSCVAERLCDAGYTPVFDTETVPENYLGALMAAAPGIVLFVDAADHGGAPGECRLATVDALAPRLASTHAPSLALLAGLLQSRGIECWLLGIQPTSTAPGSGLSPAVESAVEMLVEALTTGPAHEVHRA